MSPIVTIIILNWNGQNILSACLESLQRQTFRNFRVIVVDNGSTDGSLDLAARVFPTAEIMALGRNTGFARGNNIGFAAVDSPYTALLNNDTVAHPDWLASLVNTLENTPEAGFAACRMLLYDRPDTIDRAGDAYCRSGTAMLRGRGKPADAFLQPEWVFGACAGAALYRTAMLKKIGLFDEDFFLLYEDVDLSFRAQLQGFPCRYVPEAVVWHHGSQSIGHDSPTSIFYSHRNLEWVYIQNMPARLIGKSIALHLLYDLAALVYFAACGHLAIFLKAKLAALRGLPDALAKRRRIQARKVVGDDYLWLLMDREHFLPRLRRRQN